MPGHDGVAARRIAAVGAGIAGTVVLVVTVIVVALRSAGVPLDGARNAVPVAGPPGAALQAAPQPELQRDRDEKQRLLDTTAWIDPAAGLVRIPIGQAMALLSERGLRAAAEPGPERRR